MFSLHARGRLARRRHKAVGGLSKVTQVRVTSDGSIAVAAGWGSLRMFELPHGRQLQRLVGHTGPVWDIDLLEDADLLASGSEDKSVRVWKRSSGTPVATFRGESPITCVRIGHVDGGVVVAAGEVSGRVHVLQLRLDTTPRDSAPR